MRPARLLTLLIGSLGVFLLTVDRAGAEIKINPAGWRFPNIVTSAKEAINVTDRTPQIAGKETINKGYRKADGTFFMTYEIEGKVFGAEIDEDGKPPFEFSIMDADGDGKFESMIRHTADNKDRAYVPQWVIDYYFSVHPEVKRGPGGDPVPPNLAPAPRPKVAATPAAKPKRPAPTPADRPSP
ncbi:MAG TPA: hypothetical protein VFB95_08510 [Candidatus Cryosericum sp.]|nr:hypothetical protein [Candidatus Cryosericum sp.]